ncbi:MAG: hypothetical protein R3F39_25090 [Myxococcota bacterium]
MLSLLLPVALAASLVSAPPPPAANDARAQADALVTEGARLGEAGRWEEAVVHFKDAERLYPRAIHHCNIGLVYVRWQRYPEAQLHLARCRSRATEPLPAWVDVRYREVIDVLAAGAYAPLELRARPAAARLSIDRFPGEVLTAPVTVWLPFGRHRVVVEAAGYGAYSFDVAVTGQGARREEVSLEPLPPEVLRPPPELAPGPEPAPEPAPELVAERQPEIQPGPEPDLPRPAADASTGRAGRVASGALFGLAGAALVGGVVLHVVAANTRDDAQSLGPGAAFDEREATFKRQRAGAWALYATAGASAVAGLVVRLVSQRAPAATVTLAPRPGGAMAVLGSRW